MYLFALETCPYYYYNDIFQKLDTMLRCLTPADSTMRCVTPAEWKRGDNSDEQI